MLIQSKWPMVLSIAGGFLSHKFTTSIQCKDHFFYIYSGDGKKFQLTCIIILEIACLHFGGILTGTGQFPPKALKLCPSVVSGSSQPHGLEPARLLCSWDSRGRNTGVGALIPSVQRGAIIHTYHTYPWGAITE